MTDTITVIRESERPEVPFVGAPGEATYRAIIGDDTGAGLPIRTGIQTSQPGYQTRVHSHPYVETLTVLSGCGEAWLDGEPGRIAELTAKPSGVRTKYRSRCRAGTPSTFPSPYTPLTARTRAGRLVSSATISTWLPGDRPACSRTVMATEYASSPVAHPMLASRTRGPPVRTSAGRIRSARRRWCSSYRKKLVSWTCRASSSSQ